MKARGRPPVPSQVTQGRLGRGRVTAQLSAGGGAGGAGGLPYAGPDRPGDPRPADGRRLGVVADGSAPIRRQGTDRGQVGGVCVWALLRRLREWGMRRGRRRARPPAQLFRVWQAGRFLTPPPPPPPPGQTTRLAVRARWPAGGERGASGPKQARARRRWGAPAAPSGPVPCGRVLGRQRPGDGWRRNWGLPHKAGRRRG